MTEDELNEEIAELEARVKAAWDNKSADYSTLVRRLWLRYSTRNYIGYLKAWLPTLANQEQQK